MIVARGTIAARGAREAMSARWIARVAIVSALTCVSCGGGSALPEVVAGTGIGEVVLGMRYAELSERLGEPDALVVVNRQALLTYDEIAIEVVMASSLDDAISDDAYVLGVSAMNGARVEGVAPAMTRAEIEALVGPAAFEVASIGFWESGMSVVWRGDVARQVAVFAPFEVQTEMPEMQPALGGAR